MNNAFVNGFAASVSAPTAGTWLVERPRTAAMTGEFAQSAALRHAAAPASHGAAAQAIARPAIPVHT